MSDSAYTGPLNFAVFALDRGADLTEIAAEVRDLAATHRAEILDVELVSRTAEGGVRREEVPGELSAAETDLLDDDDLEAIAEDLAGGERALVVVYEDRTLAALASRVTQVGGRELWVGGIDAADLDIETEGGSR